MADDDDDRQDVEFGSDDEDNGEDGLGLAFGDDEGSEAGDDAAFDAGDAVGVAAGRGAGAAGGAILDPKKRMQFCGECDNLMRHVKRPGERELAWKCFLCDRLEPCNVNIVSRTNHGTSKVNPLSTIHKAMALDPTLPRANKSCPKCQADKPVYFFDPSFFPKAMKLIFLCSECGHKWVG